MLFQCKLFVSKRTKTALKALSQAFVLSTTKRVL
jgi:hypothetical protein